MNPLLDKDFLKDLAHHREKDIYIKIISYNSQGQPQDILEGIASGGSINIDGASSLRRSCSLTFSREKKPQEDTNIFFDLYWAIATEIEIFIGLKNLINTSYSDIIWFPMGYYLISSFNQKEEATHKTISISGKDKMCRLNGEMGGLFTSLTTDLGTGRDKNGQLQKIPIKEIIQKLLVMYGGENHHNIIINDLDNEIGVELLEYRGTQPLYLFENINTQEFITNYTTIADTECKIVGGKETTIGDADSITYKKLCYHNQIRTANYTPILLKEHNGYPASSNDIKTKQLYVIKVEYGELAGYKMINDNGLVYAGDFIINLGDSITSALDKIIQMLGNYEYFYNVEGQFIFQKKRNLSTFVLPNSYLDDQSETVIYDFDYHNNMTVFDFSNDELIISKDQNYNLNNIKNDFAIWGKSGDIDIYMRYAIDIRPKSYKSYDGIYYITAETNNSDYTDECYICNWREILYRMAEDYANYNHYDDFYYTISQYNPELVHLGLTKYEKYYSDILSFWRELYDPNPPANYSRITYENANNRIVNQQLDNLTTNSFTEVNDRNSIIQYTVEQRKNLYTIKNGELVRWIDSINLLQDNDQNIIDPASLFYYLNEEPIQIINSLDFITNRAYVDISGNKIELVDLLTEEEKAKIWVSDQLYSKKVKYQDYNELGVYLNSPDTYLPGNKLYIALNENKKPIDYIKINLYSNDTFSDNPVIWQYDYNVENLSDAQIYMIQEAFKSHREKLSVSVNGNELNGDSLQGEIYLLTKRELGQGILWYDNSIDQNNTIYTPLNEIFLYSINNDNETEEQNQISVRYDKHQIYFYHAETGNYIQTIDLINLNKAEIYQYQGEEKGYIRLLEYLLPDDDIELYLYNEHEQMHYNEIPNGIQIFYVNGDNVVQENFNQSTYNLKGEISSIYTTQQQRKIKYYLESFDYFLPTSNDWTNCWNCAIYDDFNKAKHWIDFAENIGSLQRYSIANIGDRVITVNNSKITGLDNSIIPEILYITNMAQENHRAYPTNILISETDLNNLFVSSGRGQSAATVIEEHINKLIKNNSSISLSTLSLYWLDVNQQVIVNNTEFIKSYYEIKRMTIPLTYNGKMSLELIALE